MTFLTRRSGEAVMIGDDIRVRVATIAGDHVVLSVAYPDERGEAIERTCSLELDDRVEIAAGTAVHVMAIRGDRVRLGIDAPDERPVTRQELRADAPKPGSPGGAGGKSKGRQTAASRAAGKRHRTHRLVVAVAGGVRIGMQMTLSLTEADAGGARVMIDGELVGGADDGLRVRESRELRVGGAPLELGTQVQVVVEKLRPDGGATLLVTAPVHVDVGLA